MQQARAIVTTCLKASPWRTVSRGFARTRRAAPKNPHSEAAVAAAAAVFQVPTDSAQMAFVAKASKIISDMSSKSSSTYIKEGEIEENNAWNWVPPRDGEREDDEIIPIKLG